MKLPEEIPEVVDLRAWLEWVATEHWDLLAVFVLSGTPVSDGQSVRDVIHEAMLKILRGKVDLLNGRADGVEATPDHHRLRRAQLAAPREGA